MFDELKEVKTKVLSRNNRFEEFCNVKYFNSFTMEADII